MRDCSCASLQLKKIYDITHYYSLFGDNCRFLTVGSKAWKESRNLPNGKTHSCQACTE